MSDSPDHKSKPHTSVHHDLSTGHRHVLRADNTADALRLELQKSIEDYGLQDRVEYQVEALEGPWIRFEVKYVGEWDVDDFSGFPTDVEKAMQGLPHGYYEVREQGQSEDGMQFWFIARHDGGPLI